MESKRRRSVWTILKRLGHAGDRDEIVQHVFEATSRVAVRSDDGEPMDGGDFLVEVFDALGTTKDWPPCGSREWRRLRAEALRIVVARLAREGLLDAISVTPDLDANCEPGTHAADADGGADAPGGRKPGEMPGIGAEVAAAMLRRGQDNPARGFRCLRRDTPMSVIWRWASGACPDAPKERLVALADDLRRVAWVDEDGHILGGVMLRALEDELEAGSGDERWMLVVSDFDEAIGMLRSVFERLALL